MKLIDFTQQPEMNKLLDTMGAVFKTMTPTDDWVSFDDKLLLELMQTGEVELDLSQVEIIDGTFEYKGQKVIVYIRDQYGKYYSSGYKFHLTNCSTIKNANSNNRKSRYVFSKRVDGIFKINVIGDYGQVTKKDIEAPLKVCKNCLTQIDYCEYSSSLWTKKVVIFDNFTLESFFGRQQSPDLNSENYRSAESAPLNVYADNFNKISDLYRKRMIYTCEECNLDLSNNKRLLHTHHIDGDKSNNATTNLKALCIGCHAEEPQHGWVKHNADYFEWERLYGNRVIL